MGWKSEEKANGKEERCLKGFREETLKEDNHNIKLDFKGLGWKFVNGSHLAHDRDP